MNDLGWFTETSPLFWPAINNEERLLMNQVLWGKGGLELKGKRRLVLWFRYVEECTFNDIGQALGISGGRARQLHEEAVRDLYRWVMDQTMRFIALDEIEAHASRERARPKARHEVVQSGERYLEGKVETDETRPCDWVSLADP